MSGALIMCIVSCLIIGVGVSSSHYYYQRFISLLKIFNYPHLLFGLLLHFELGFAMLLCIFVCLQCHYWQEQRLIQDPFD
jgi:hypothetical protein